MRIETLRLTSFRSFVDTEFVFNGPRILIAGVNGAGKSSIREGIKYILTGTCQGVDGKGAGQVRLVPTFEGKNVAAELTLANIGSVSRSWIPSGSTLEVQGMEGDKGDVQRGLYEKLGAANGFLSGAFLDAVLDSNVFMRLHHADAKALVLALLDVKVPVPQMNTDYTLSALDAAHDKAFEERKAAKARLKGAFVPPVPLDQKWPEIEKVKERLGLLRSELGEKQQAIGGTTARRKALQDQVSDARLVTSRTDHKAEIADLEERLAIMEADATQPTAPTPDVQQPVTKTGEVDVVKLKSRAQTLQEFQPKNGCVLDDQIDCPVHRLKFKNRGKDLQSQIDSLPAAAPSTPSAPPPVNPLTQVRRQLEQLKTEQTAFESDQQRIADDQAAQDDIRRQLAELPDVSEQEKEIADVQERIRKGEGIKAEIESYQRLLAAYQDALHARQALEAEVERLERLVEVLGPSGARVQALGAALGTFTAAINPVLAPFGWMVDFCLDPWGVVVNGRLVETYSKSEQYRIGIAVQVAIAQLSGLDFCIVDELDILLKENRELMSRILATATLGQILIMSAREPELALPQVPGVIAYRLGKDGDRSVILERVGA